jgi:S1-C subfamily serine protease
VGATIAKCGRPSGQRMVTAAALACPWRRRPLSQVVIGEELVVDQPNTRRRDLFLISVLTLLAVSLVGALALSSCRPESGESPPVAPLEPPPPPPPPFSFEELSAASRRVIGELGTTVVFIEVRRDGDGPTNEQGLAHLFGDAQDAGEAPAQGSGVVVDPNGYVLTNAHVVRDSRQVAVHLASDDVADAEVVGIDAASDLALLKIDRQNLPSIEWADSDEIAVGDFLWVIGSPLGLEKSVSFGIISGTNRRLPSLPEVGLLQTDAAINPGSSGGPLVDSKGRVVGISSAIVGRGHQGIGFAVPANVARQVFLNLLSD